VAGLSAVSEIFVHPNKTNLPAPDATRIPVHLHFALVLWLRTRTESRRRDGMLVLGRRRHAVPSERSRADGAHAGESCPDGDRRTIRDCFWQAVAAWSMRRRHQGFVRAVAVGCPDNTANYRCITARTHHSLKPTCLCRGPWRSRDQSGCIALTAGH